MRINSTLAYVLTAAGVFVLGVLIFNYLIMPMVVHRHNTVLIPELAGMSGKQAERELRKLNLECQTVRKEFAEGVPEGYVVSQNPRANESVKEGRTVSIVLSLGPKMQRVPEVVGLPLRQCRMVLGRNHFKVGRIAKKVLVGESPETVVATSPGAGIEVAEGGTVDILISVGGRPRSFMMPDLAGQDLLFVRTVLERKGFRIGAVRYELRQGAYPNTIVGQIPKPGCQIREGDSIELVAATTR
ncbi:MAG: PASTA domain-containing protein [Chitinivibrionia bacterium]|nr:PASTA domain-containing protein [Chitinivibrionia bacterium]